MLRMCTAAFIGSGFSKPSESAHGDGTRVDCFRVVEQQIEANVVLRCRPSELAPNGFGLRRIVLLPAVLEFQNRQVFITQTRSAFRHSLPFNTPVTCSGPPKSSNSSHCAPRLSTDCDDRFIVASTPAQGEIRVPNSLWIIPGLHRSLVGACRFPTCSSLVAW